MVRSFSEDQARNKWKTLQTAYAKEAANQPILRSGAAAQKPRRTWCHFNAMSFMKDTIAAESSGNIDFLDDSEEADDSATGEISESSSNYYRQIAPEPSFALDSPENQGDWHFLLSVLPYIDRIPGGEDVQMEFKLAAHMMVVNFRTQNKLAKQIKEVQPSVKTENMNKENIDKNIDKDTMDKDRFKNNQVKIEKLKTEEVGKVQIDKRRTEEVGKHLIFCSILLF